MSIQSDTATLFARPTPVSAAPVSLFRLYALRGGYLLLVLGLGLQVWPALIDHAEKWELMNGVVKTMLCALSLLAILGLRYPLKMLPLLFWEMAWKTIWLARVALPLWLGNRVNADFAETIFECSFVIIFFVVVPWSYVFANFAKAPGDRWR